METNYNSNRVHIFVLILSQLTSNYQCDLDPALIQISRLKIKIRIKTVNIWKVWRILLPTVVYDSSTIDGNLPNISEGTIWSRSDNRPIRLTQCCTQFKAPGDKILCVLYLHYNVAFTFKWYGNFWNRKFYSQRVWIGYNIELAE